MNSPIHSIRILHVMLRVQNLERSIEFYRQVLGMKVLRQQDYPAGQFTLAFMGYKDESGETAIELTYNWGKSDYEKGTAFGHLAFAVKDIYSFFRRLNLMQVCVTREPAPMQFDSSEMIGFFVDPDGYVIEIIERT